MGFVLVVAGWLLVVAMLVGGAMVAMVGGAEGGVEEDCRVIAKNWPSCLCPVPLICSSSEVRRWCLFMSCASVFCMKDRFSCQDLATAHVPHKWYADGWYWCRGATTQVPHICVRTCVVVCGRIYHFPRHTYDTCAVDPPYNNPMYFDIITILHAYR
jgi:hypothetical protein